MKKSIEELNAIRERMKQTIQMRSDNSNNVRVVVGMATCGIAAGARPVLAAFVDEVNRRQLKNVTVAQTGCIGVCRLEPIVEIYEPGKEKVTYVKVDENKARMIVAEHLVNQRVIEEYTIGAAK
ncbi:MAG: (2Fe-2S) ferredoxin domain-containing protein [Clostridiales bacterium]|nr:(2Fe-2S) ferredoxin domain-containing protein [Clostridiales bacterium]